MRFVLHYGDMNPSNNREMVAADLKRPAGEKQTKVIGAAAVPTSLAYPARCPDHGGRYRRPAKVA